MARARREFARAKSGRQPKRRFIIYCEGRKTEPGYFNEFNRARGALIDVEVVPAGVPLTVAEAAVARAKREGLAKGSSKRRRDSFAAADQVWAVFDRDEHPNFEAAIELCSRHGVSVGRSNPCFEIWLILHVEDFNRPDDRHALGRHLSKLRPEYEPNGAKTCRWRELLASVEDAETRAANQLAQRSNEGAPFGTPSTTVGELTKAIREAAKRSAR